MGETAPSNEEPVHRVKLDSFYIGIYEVTLAEWESVMGENISPYKGNTLPAQAVSWFLAVEYCNKRSRKEGLTPCYAGKAPDITCNFQAGGYRLPTEAEWEFACRGGIKSKDYVFSGSNQAGEVAWYEENCRDAIQPVGKKKPNELGIYDMNGNMWEWCWDWFKDDYYKTSPAENPRGPESGERRAYRGGGGPRGHVEWLRNTARYSFQPTFHNIDMGLRVVKKAVGNIPPNMVRVEGGAFDMGKKGGGVDKKPVHAVSIKDFYLGKYEVTQGQWTEVMGKNFSYFRGPLLPAESVTWYQAVEYCNKRSQMEGLTPCYSGQGDAVACNFGANGYRLPTEAEWEFASKGGARSRNFKFSGGNQPDDVAWYSGNIVVSPRPVGMKKTNELGIHDMSGNVWEWTWDWYGWDYYAASPAKDPRGPGSGVRRVIRGGSAYQAVDGLKCVERESYMPYHTIRVLGFRVARSAAAGEK